MSNLSFGKPSLINFHNSLKLTNLNVINLLNMFYDFKRYQVFIYIHTYQFIHYYYFISKSTYPFHFAYHNENMDSLFVIYPYDDIKLIKLPK
jgi:hypothetical protein